MPRERLSGGSAGGSALQDFQLSYSLFGMILETSGQTLFFGTGPAWKDVYALTTKLEANYVFGCGSGEASVIVGELFASAAISLSCWFACATALRLGFEE